MRLRPTYNRVLVKLGSVEEKTKGGIVISDAYANRAAKGAQLVTVVELGPDAFHDTRTEREWCQEGDKVFIVRYCGEDYVDPKTNEMYRIINDVDIIAIVDDEEEDL